MAAERSGLMVEVKGAKELAGSLRLFPKELAKERRRALRRSAQIVAKKWKQALSGPRGPRRLGVVTGQLRSSIQAGPVVGDIVRVGTDKPYAAAHEFGFRGLVRVRAHTRTLKSGKQFPVRGHRRQMMLPKRPHRRPAMRLSRDPVRAELDKAVKRAIEAAKRKGERGAG